MIINPGAGPVANANEQNAIDNMAHFITDCNRTGLHVARTPEFDEDGRYGFVVFNDATRCHVVEMPGCPLDQVRYMDEPHQNIWNFPRLYVNGGSWVWCFALLTEDHQWVLP